MTCTACKTTVENALKTINGIASVSVHLQNAEATIKTSTPLPLKVLQAQLPKKYTISEKKVTIFKTQDTKQKSDLKALYPLFLIFAYITITSLLLNTNPWNINSFMLDFMGLFYIVFSFFKLLDLKGFPESFKMYDPLAKVMPLYGWVYPFVEVALGLMFLMRFQIPVALITTLVILGITTVGVSKVLFDKKSIRCACLGTALKLPMTKATFIENSIMIIMAITMLFNIYN